MTWPDRTFWWGVLLGFVMATPQVWVPWLSAAVQYTAQGVAQAVSTPAGWAGFITFQAGWWSSWGFNRWRARHWGRR